MNVAIVTEYYYPTLGGIQEHVHHFAACARRAGHRVQILTPSVKDQLASTQDASASARADREDDVVRIGESVSLVSGGSLARASVGPGLRRRMSEVLRSGQFDVVHVHSPLMPTLPFLALRASRGVNVGTFHSAFDRSLIMELARPILQRYVDRLDAAIGVSETALVGPRRYFRAPWRILPNGVDTRFFASGRRRPEFDDGRPNLLHVGRFDPRNGVDRVIRSWIALRRGGRDARLILVGDGPLRATYQAMVPSDLAHDAHFIGFVPGPERPDWYATGDILMCPTVGGTFGIILLEAMAAGCAIVAADTPGFRHVMEDGVQGAMVSLDQPDSDQALAAAADALLGDDVRRRRAADAGRATAARYDWAAVTDRVLGLYRELLDGARLAS